MSMVTKRAVHEWPVAYCVDTESDFNSDSNSFIKGQAKNCSPKKSATAVCEIVTLDCSVEPDDTESFKGFADKTRAEISARAKYRSPKKSATVVCDTLTLDSSIKLEDTERFKGFSQKTRAEIRAQAKNEPVQKSVTVCETVTLESSIELDNSQSSEVDLRPTRKRRRISSSSDESFQPRSYSASPEISYGGDPVIYKLREEEGRVFIIKVPMSSNLRTRRSQKCTDQDISNLLDLDGEDLTIFDSVGKKGKQVVRSLQNVKKYTESPQTPKRSKRHLAASNSEQNSPRSSQFRSETLQSEEVSLKLKLRRSTEQSNYKIAVDLDEEENRRSTRRSNVGTPKKCGFGDCDEDHGVYTRIRRSPQKTPKGRNVLKESAATTPRNPRRTRRNSNTVDCNSDVFEIKSLHNKENESEVDNDMDEDTDSIGCRDRSAREKSRSATPQMEGKKLKDNTRETPRKGSKKMKEATTPSRGYLETAHIIDAFDDNEKSIGSREHGARKEAFGTPQKQIKKADETPSTPSSSRPRRNSRSVYYNYDILENNLLDDNEIDDAEGIGETRGRATRRSAASRQGTATPQKQRKVLEEATTPKRTPRRSAVQKLEEVATPKRTPKKPATILEVDEPTTPSASTRKRNSKALTPSVKHGNLTPSMTRRTANAGKPKTILEEARAQLHVSSVPKSLPCRDDEFNDIFRFLESKLLDKSSGCIYISGVPGTGKTATVTEAIRALKRCVVKEKLDNFDFIEINGMKLSEPRQAYVQILKQITGETATWEQAHGILDKRFTKSNAKRPMTLLLVDELDLLCNKRQDVVYNLLDWPATRNAHLVVITIANTMDLPERILMSRVTSRLGLTRLTFQPYTYKQLQEIVTARLKDSVAFKSEAIQLVARKVAAVSGDARRALDICRRATEITELKGEKIVTMPHVNEALGEMISSAKVKAIKMCSEMEIFFLRAVDAEVTRTGVEEVVFHDIYRQLTTICSFEGIKTPNVTQALGICSRLSAYRLLLCEQTRNDSERRIILNVSSDDIHFAMQTFDVS